MLPLLQLLLYPLYLRTDGIRGDLQVLALLAATKIVQSYLLYLGRPNPRTVTCFTHGDQIRGVLLALLVATKSTDYYLLFLWLPNPRRVLALLVVTKSAESYLLYSWRPSPRSVTCFTCGDQIHVL